MIKRLLAEPTEELTASIIGAAFEVSNVLGHGFLEAIYRKAMVRELSVRGLSVAEAVQFDVKYKEETLGRY